MGTPFPGVATRGVLGVVVRGVLGAVVRGVLGVATRGLLGVAARGLLGVVGRGVLGVVVCVEVAQKSGNKKIVEKSCATPPAKRAYKR